MPRALAAEAPEDPPRALTARRSPKKKSSIQYSPTTKTNNQVENKVEMDVVDLVPAVERLDDNIDDLEEALQKLLGSSLEETSRKLPLLDRAKLHVLVTYTLESLLVSYLRLHGVDANSHPVYTELARLKQYFTKIQDLEKGPEKRTMSLDKGAAKRFISHGLSGNDKYDVARAEKEAKEKARAQLKAALMAKKKESKPESPASAAVSQESNDTPQSTSRPDSDSNSDSDSSSDSESEDDTEEVAKDDAAKEFKDSTEYIELPTEEPTRRETAKEKSKTRRQELISNKKAAKRAKREENQDKKQKQRNIRKERKLKKNAMKREKRAKEKAARAK